MPHNGIRKRAKKKRRREHVNKYAHLAPPKRRVYDAHDKTYRDIFLDGRPGQHFEAGRIFIYHRRLYRLLKDVVIPPTGQALARFKLNK